MIVTSFLAFYRKNKLAILSLVIIFFLGFVGLLVQEAMRRTNDLSVGAIAPTARLSFSPTSTAVMPGNSFDIDVILDTGGEAVVANDLVFNFDSARLSLVNILPQPHPVFMSYLPASTTGTFDSAAVVSQANTTGRIEFSIVAVENNSDGTVAAYRGGFNGIVSPLVRLTFQAKPNSQGQASIGFGYDGVGVTTDSNVMIEPDQSGVTNDILAAPNSNVSIVIALLASPNPTATPAPTTSPTPTPQASVFPRSTPPSASASPKPSAVATPVVSPIPTSPPSPQPTATPNPSGDSQPPSVTIVRPANGITFKTGPISILATAEDVSGIKTLELRIDNRLVKTCRDTNRCEYKWGVRTAAEGKHTISAKATDKSSSANSASATITVTKQCNFKFLRYCVF